MNFWSGNLSWDYPIFIFLALGAGVGFFIFLMRMVNPKPPKKHWECLLCGAKFSGSSQDQFRFCPYCGTPRNERAPRRYREEPAYDESDDDFDFENDDLI